MTDQHTLTVPGAGGLRLRYTRDEETGALLRLSCARTVHLTATRMRIAGDGPSKRQHACVLPDGHPADGGDPGVGVSVYGDGLARVTEVTDDSGLTRTVEAAGESWTERYEWDAAGLLSLVDGVRVERDEHGRVIACGSDTGTWRYGYAGTDLTVIDTPEHTRHVTTDLRGRPALHRVEHHVTHDSDGTGGTGTGGGGGARRIMFEYDADGLRTDAASLPGHYHRDRAGRLWTVTRPDGSVRYTYLWDGARCLGRIDGPPDQPLTAVFSLDPSGTPVRVITRRRVLRIPRDAYGEALLAHRGVPGLFGGAVYRGLVHLARRSLDPRVGAFTAPDPFDGGPDDPRRHDRPPGPPGPSAADGPPRADGPSGADGAPGAGTTRRVHGVHRARSTAKAALPVETGVGSRYVVCRHDPVGRADPTGAIAWWLPLSDLTWSWQNNVLATMGLDLTVNFWASLFTGNLGAWGGTLFRGVSSSDRVGAYAFARDGGLAADRAFTYQHFLLGKQSMWDELRQTRCVVPDERFVPRLRGTLLRVQPSGAGTPAVVRGDGALAGVGTLPDWSRAGGPAEPVVPGSPVPWFPTGGLHTYGGITRIPAGQDATLDELGPLGAPVTGTITVESDITLQGTGLGLTVGGFVALRTGTQVVMVEVTQVTENDGRTIIRLGSQPTGSTTGVTLRGLTAVAGTEQRLRGRADSTLTGIGATLPYAVGDILRLSRTGTVQGAALVTAFTAQLRLDSALPATVAAPLTVTRVDAGGAAAVNVTLGPNPDQFRLPVQPPAPAPPAFTPPGQGSVIVLVVGPARRAVVVTSITADAAGDLVTVDTAVAAAPPGGLGLPGTAATFTQFVTGATLGTRTGAVETDPLVTYTPTSTGQAPAVGDVVLVGDPAGTRAARLVTVREYDDVDLGGPLPFVDAATPYDVERFTPAPPDQPVDVESTQVLTSSTPLAAAQPGAVALRVQQFQATTLAEVLAAGAVPFGGPVTVTDDTVTVAGAPPDGALRPGHAIVLTRGAEDPELATVRSVRVTVELDRDTGIAGPVRLTQLGRTGPTYAATRVDDHVVTALPQLDTGERLQFPRVRQGELVVVTWTLTGTADTEYHLVTAVDGTTYTLHPSGRALPAAATAIGVRRLVPTGTDHGTAHVGLDGTRDAVDPRVYTVSAWRADDYTAFDADDSPLAVSDGATAVPAVVTAVTGWEVVLGAEPARLTGAGVQLVLPADAQAVQFNPSFTAVDTEVRLADAVTTTVLPVLSGGLLCLVTGFGPTGEPDTAVPARLSQGGVRVPEAAEEFEIDREQSLLDHEMTHTIQSAAWGPLLLAWCPLWAFQLGAELRTGVESPTYSPYLTGTVTRLAGMGGVELTVPSPGAVTFAVDDEVQISHGSGNPSVVRILGVEAPGRFTVTEPNTSGEVSLRKVNNTAAWAGGTIDALQLLTHGGALNATAGTVWGGLFWAIARGVAALGSLFANTTKYRATVTDDTTLELVTTGMSDRDREKALLAFRNVDRITIHQDGTLVRALARESEPPTLRLAEGTFYTGEISIAPYRTTDWGSGMPWKDYFPATIADRDRPSALTVQPVGTTVLQLRVGDRVEVMRRYDTPFFGALHTYVTHVGAAGAIEVRDPVLVDGEAVDENVRIAKIASSDPVGWLDSWVMERLGMGWLRWAFDPWGNLSYRVQPTPGSWQYVLLRVVRHVMSTQSWSAAIPGYFIWFNLIRQPDNGHLSPMEQEASRESGDLYSSLARLHAPPAVVGDVGRYWYFSGSRFDSVITTGQRDNPGPHIDATARVIPLRTAETGATGDRPPLNRGAAAPASPGATVTTTAPAAPGGAVPDALARKSDADPREPDGTAPRSFTATDAAAIPLTAETDRALGVYVAFSRPGTHRVTLEDFPRPTGTDEPQDEAAVTARAAHDANDKARVFYEPDVADITATVAGAAVADGDTVTLVQTQQARLLVAGATPGDHTLTTLRPAGGAVLRTDGTALIAMAANTAAPEPVEVTRVYRVGADGTYSSGGLAGRTMHLAADLHIPVRALSITVTDVLPVRSAAGTTAATVATVAPGGSVFVLVPAATCAPLAAQLPATYPDGTAMDLAPVIAPVADLPDDVRAFIGDGQAYEIAFPADQNPHQQLDIPLVTTTWIPEPGLTCTDPTATRATLTARITLTRT
jgi:large repetitive protein